MALSIGGERTTGQSVRTQNVMAATAIANIVKTSLGPVGLDKMMVDEVGDVTITNDGATILKLLEVEHPAAKILVDLAQLQDNEIGDGTTTVVIMAAELLKNAEELIKFNIHPTTVISGYRMACKEACRYIQEQLVTEVNESNTELLLSAARTSMASKIINTDAEFFAKMAVEAAISVKVADAFKEKKVKYPIKSINVLKAHGKSLRETQLIKGYALNCTVASQLMPKSVQNAKIALLDFSLSKIKLPLGIQVIVNEPEKLEAIKQREADVTKERIEKILAAGANVVLTTGGIDDLCLKYFVEKGVMAVRRCKKQDLKRIAKATGGNLLVSLSNMDGEEACDPNSLGEAEKVAQDFVGDNECMFIYGPKVRKAASIIIRGANDVMLDEAERSLHDALCVIKRVLESGTVVAGGGCCETAASVYLENLATSLASREQLAVAEFANALLCIPKQLAVNAALDATDLVAKLRSAHYAAQTKQDLAMNKWFGLDLIKGAIRDNRQAGVFEPAISKIKSLRFATEAAITILRIDDLIKLEPEKKGGRGEEY